jgi:hypothetical protein
MKRLLIAAMFISTSLMAQDDELPVVWESEFENKAKVLSICNGDGSLLIGSDPNEATGMDGSGKVTWSGKYKTINGDGGAGESEYQYVYWGPDLLFLFDKKAGKDRVSVVDVKTGKGLWNSNEYSGLGEDNIDYIAEMDAFMFCMKSANVLVDARTGRKIWETSIFKGSVGKYIYFPSSKEMLMINYKPTWLSALFSGFKNQLVRINATNGNVIWDVEYRGIVEKEVLTRKPIVDIDVKGDKIFLQLDGLQVFDFQNGKEIWSAVYESDQGVRTNFWNRGPHGGKVLKGGVYGAISKPLYTEDAVYIVLGSDKLKTKFVQKHDLNSGKILWTSEKITSAMALPAIHLQGDRLVVQVGGIVNKQTIERVINRTQTGTETITYYNNEYDFMGSFGVLALNTADGKQVWRSEKFDKRISNLVFGEGMVFAGSGDEFYGFDVKTGEMKINVDHSKGKVGKTMWAFDNGDNVALVCDNGMAAYSKKDGAKVYNTDKFRGVTNYHHLGNNFFLRREKESSNTIAAVDLKTGVIKGIVKSKGKGGGDVYGDGLDVTDDGEYIFSFRGKGVQKIKVNR